MQASEPTGSLSSRPKSIYGPHDSRRTLDEVARDGSLEPGFSAQVLKAAQCVACLMHQSKLHFNQAKQCYVLTDLAERFGSRLYDGYPVGEYERFVEEQAPGMATGFLVGKDLLLTAAHCVTIKGAENTALLDLTTLERMRFVFDFFCASQTAHCELEQSSVYSFRSVVSYKLIPSGQPHSQDWALIQLDRVVSGREPLEMDFNWQAEIGQQVCMLGHPCGLPMKYAGSAQVRRLDQHQVDTNLDAFEGNSGSPIFHYAPDGKNGKIRVVAMLIRGQKDMSLIRDYHGSGKTRSAPCHINDRRAETGTRIDRLDFLKAFLPSLDVSSSVHTFDPGLSVEGPCPSCNKERVIPRAFSHPDRPIFNLDRVRFEVTCPKCHGDLEWDKVNRVALTRCFYQIEGATVRLRGKDIKPEHQNRVLKVRHRDLLLEGMMLRFDYQDWGYLEVQTLPLLNPYEWPKAPLSVQETTSGPFFTWTLPDGSLRCFTRDQVEGWLPPGQMEVRDARHLDRWNPILSQLTPHLNNDPTCLTFGLCQIPLQTGTLVGFWGPDALLTWKLFRKSKESIISQIKGLPELLGESTTLHELASRVRFLLQQYEVKVRRGPRGLRLQFSLKTSAQARRSISPPLTSLQLNDADPITPFLRATLSCLKQGDLQSCYDYLNVGLQHLKEWQPVSYLSILGEFQQAVLESDRPERVQEWICPDRNALLVKLANKALNQPSFATHLTDWIIESTGESNFRRDTLLAGYRLARHHNNEWQQRRLLTSLAKAYELYGKTLPISERYPLAFRPAATCLNIALSLAPEEESLHQDLSQLTAACYKGMEPTPEGTIEWARQQLHLSPIQAITQIAELHVEYGDTPTARRLYGLCPQDPTTSQRYLALSQSEVVSLGLLNWQTHRQQLQAIQQHMTCLFSSYFAEKPLPVTPSEGFPPYALASIEEIACEQSPSLPNLINLNNKLQSQFTAHLYQQAVALFGPPPCSYVLVALRGLDLREVNLYPSLQLCVLVKDKTEKSIEYFSKVGSYFELLILNLGTMRLDLAGFQHLQHRFALEKGPIHPAKAMTPTELVNLQLECPGKVICGDSQLYDQYKAQLDRHLLGVKGQLLANWQSPNPKEEDFQAHKDLLHPLSLLLNAMAVMYPDLETRSPSFTRFSKQAESFAQEIHLRAQLHYRSQRDTVYLLPNSEEPNPFLLTFRDWELYEQINTVLFQAAEKMDLLQGFDFDFWEKVRLDYVETLIYGMRLDRAQELAQDLSDPPTDLQAKLALWQGKFVEAHAISISDSGSIQHIHNPYHKTLETYQALPQDVVGLNLLMGRLHLLRMQDYRKSLAPPNAVFKGPDTARKSALWRFLSQPQLAEETRSSAWEYAQRCFEGEPLPTDEDELLRALCSFEKPQLSDLLYRDLVLRFQVVLRHTQDQEVCRTLFHLLPKEIRRRFLDAFAERGGDLNLVRQLLHFPDPDGSRPLLPPARHRLDFAPFVGASQCQLEGVETTPIYLGAHAVQFLSELANGHGIVQHTKHNVKESLGIYFKLDPEFPGRAHARLTLERLITGTSFPPRELIKVHIGGKPRAITASETVPGKTLEEVFRKNPECLDRVDFRHFSYQAVMDMVTLPEDNKPDNIVVYEPSAGAPLQLVVVDAERNFFKAMKKASWSWLFSDTLQCKSAIWCLDAMKRPIDEEVRDELLALNPAMVLHHWLESVDHFNRRCTRLFGEKFIDAGLQRKPSSTLPLFIEPTILATDSDVPREKGLVLQLYEKLKRLQDELRSSPKITLIQLLCNLEPDLGSRYKVQLDKKKSPKQRWELCEPHYTVVEGKEGTISITSTVLKTRFKSVAAFREEGWTLENARSDLNRNIDGAAMVEVFRADLTHAEGEMLKAFDLPGLSSRVLKGLDFSQFHKSQQQQILWRITGLQFTSLHLRKCCCLDDTSLKRILDFCPNLTTLDLESTTGPTYLGYLSTRCSKLQKLVLRGVKTLTSLSCDGYFSKAPLVLNQLKILDLRDYSSLQRIDIKVPKLQELRCSRGNSLLSTDLKLQIPTLKRLVIEKKLDFGLWWESPLSLLRRVKALSVHLKESQQKAYRVEPPFEIAAAAIFRRGKRVIYASSASNGALAAKTLCEFPDQVGKVAHWQLEGLHSGQTPPAISTLFTIRSLLKICAQSPGLQHLDLFDTGALKDEHLIELVDKCPNLETVNLSKCRKLTDRAMTHLVLKNPHLKQLDLSGCFKLTDATLKAIALHCPQLEALNLSGCHRISHAAIRFLVSKCSLRDLDLTACYSLTATQTLKESGLTDYHHRESSSYNPSFTQLVLTGMAQLKGDALQELCRRVAKPIRALEIEGCASIQDSHVGAGWQQRMQILALSGCVKLSSRAIISLAGFSLQFLDITGCVRLKDRAIEELIRYSSSLKRLKMERCTLFTPDKVIELVRTCTGLTSLYLDECDQFKEADLLNAGLAGNNLRTLSLSGCQQTTGSVIQGIAQHCTQLTSLQIARCERIGDEEIIGLAHAAPGLRHLDLTGCHQVGDASLNALAANCTQLRSLYLGNTAITSDMPPKNWSMRK